MKKAERCDVVLFGEPTVTLVTYLKTLCQSLDAAELSDHYDADLVPDDEENTA